MLRVPELNDSRAATLRNPGDGRVIAIVGDVYRFLATGAETGGRYCLLEAMVPPGGGPPPHVHSREEEGFYVIEGEMTFLLGDRRIAAGPGTYVNVPTGVLHSFKNEGATLVRMLINVAPAGLEQMFFEVGQPLPAGTTSAAPPGRDEIERLLAAAPRYGIEIRLPGNG